MLPSADLDSPSADFLWVGYHKQKPFSLENDWFSGKAQITTFLVEEILSTKFRALLQRDKGRDPRALAGTS
jgi:hypothetical protein